MRKYYTSAQGGSMKANGKDIIEVIRMGEWSILNMLESGRSTDEDGPGVVHRPCDGWIRFGMRQCALYCRVCHDPIPEGIVTLWLLLAADKNCSKCYYNEDPDFVTSLGVSS
jgi:hypothetical protein